MAEARQVKQFKSALDEAKETRKIRRQSERKHLLKDEDDG